MQEYLNVIRETCAGSVAELKPPHRPTTVRTAGWTPEFGALHRRAPEALEAGVTEYRETCRNLRRAMF